MTRPGAGGARGHRRAPRRTVCRNGGLRCAGTRPQPPAAPANRFVNAGRYTV